MLLDNLILYEKNYKIEMNKPESPFFYFFDYDDRSYSINMEFQHFHRFYEFCIFLDQSADHIIEGDIFDIRFGDIVALKPSLLHKTQYHEGAPKKRLIINFNLPMELEGISNDFSVLLSLFEKPVPIYRFEGSYKDDLFKTLNDIFILSKKKTSINNVLIYTKFMEFLSKIYLYQDQNIYVVHSSGDNLTNKIYSITSYIHEHYSDSLSLDFLSSNFFISSYYLSHQFKRITGFTLNSYIQMTRIRNAQQLLLSTNTRITDISDSCGFSSFSQFNRTFRKYCGLSPSKYRKDKDAKAIISFHITE